MSGKKKLDRWICAAQAMNVQQNIPENYLVANDNPEKVVIQKDLFFSLSIEARYVIRLLLNCPLEIFETIGMPKERSSYQVSVFRFLRKEQGYPIVEARKIIKELRIFVKEFCSI